jgi:predicted dehydrogenase
MHDSTRFSRRGFLARGVAMAAGGLAVPCLIPAGVLAGPDNPGANNRIGIGFIGSGRRAEQLMSFSKDGRIVALSDCDRRRVEEMAAKRQCRAYQDYRKLLESKDVDAVIIATPHHWHALPAIHACQAGKDVYCEKPLTLTIREGRVMVNAARKYQRIFQTGSQQRSTGPNRLGCEMVRSGRIGKILTVIGANYPGPQEDDLPGEPCPEGLDWDRWLGQAPEKPYHRDRYLPHAKPGWMALRPYSGGGMTDWGAHGLDQVQWALGMDDTGPVEVVPEGKGPNAKVVLRYANGVELKLDNGPWGGGRFLGEKGTITICRNLFQSDPPQMALDAMKGTDWADLYKAPHRGIDTYNHQQNWFDCIKSRKTPVADVEIGHRSVTVCHLANIGRWLGRKLRWDPEKEVFPGDDEANRFVDRPKRKPYELPATI